VSNDAKTFRVLFVCWGNICRSPAGENTFRHLLAESPWSELIECDSAGTINAHAGKRPDRRMQKTLERRGIDVGGAARQIQVEDFDKFDLILTMDHFNRDEVLAMARSDADRRKVRPFTVFCETHEETEVPDPYYGGESGFELVADLIADGCQGLLEHIEAQLSS
jgi:protein-tyrosine phosphatase